MLEYSAWAGFRSNMQDAARAHWAPRDGLNPFPEGTPDHERWWASLIQGLEIDAGERR